MKMDMPSLNRIPPPAVFYVLLTKILNGEIHKCMTKTQIHTFKFEIPVQFVQPHHCQHSCIIQLVGVGSTLHGATGDCSRHFNQQPTHWSVYQHHFVYSSWFMAPKSPSNDKSPVDH